ncbi:SEN1 N terminal-domain-containing protein [Hysterangium stoloniferum]|nr:SEN1 N terminal-domain-containing protein [Hysterangium stoloniferum]
MGGAPLPNEAEVSRILDRLKREPVNTDGAPDTVLGPVYSLLIKAPAGEDRILHWFCGSAKPVVVEAATFLLRLHAYTNNPRVDNWKDKMAGVLHGCCNCLQSYMDIKISCRETYFAAFSKPVLDEFFLIIDKWEAAVILNAVQRAGITFGSKRSVSDVPSAVFYHILISIPVFQMPEILQLLEEHPPAFHASGWPNELPPGLLLLLFHQKMEVRTWSQQQVFGCSAISEDKFTGGYETVFRALVAALSLGMDRLATPSPLSDIISGRNLQNYLSVSTSALWSGLQTFLRILPSGFLKSENRIAHKFCHAIVGHLHDKIPHFPDILRAFIYLVKKHGKILWEGEDLDYPQVIFDSIKDNPAYISLIQDMDTNASQQAWFLEWFHAYLNSLEGMNIFEEVVKKIAGFACEELQHERFENKRPMIMASILRTLDTVLRSSISDDTKLTIIHVLDIHADVTVNVALSTKLNLPSWQTARVTARRFLDHSLTTDAIRAETVIFQISDVLQQSNSSSERKPKYKLSSPIFHKEIWKTMYETVTPEDSEGLELLISLVARSASFDMLNTDAFNPPTLLSDSRQDLAGVITTVNTGLHAMRAGFLDAVKQFTNSTSITTETVQRLVRREDMIKHLMSLLLSPVEELQMSAQILIGQAYDVDVRSECFRAIIKDLPVPSLDGLASIIRNFNEAANILPEACNFAKSVVRCMTDVIEVLTNGHDGLLFDEQFGNIPQGIRPQARLPSLWGLMCRAITTIFRRTPLWSKVIDPDAMIDWMRDALIFGREIVAQRRTFEASSIAISQASRLTLSSPRKPSQIGKQMLEDLQPVLTESIRWLRLTDMELLHQSSNLVQTLMDCFMKADVKPSQDTLTKLEKFLDSSRRQSIPESLKTRLSATHISELTAALAFFTKDEDEDEIQFIPSLKHKTSLVPSKIGKPSSQTPSLMSQVRSQVAAKTTVHLPGGIRPLQKVDIPSNVLPKDERIRPSIKNESASIAPGNKSVSSSSEDEDEDGEEAGGLAALGNLQKSPLAKKKAERRSIKLMEPRFTGQNVALDRIRKREEAQRATLRMKPDLRPLHRIILSWNYDHDGPEPPTSGNHPIYNSVPDDFESDETYQNIFEPLLTLECWTQLIKSKEETTEMLICTIHSRQYIDEWLELDVSMTERIPDKWRLAETDIVLLRRTAGQTCILTKVQGSNRRGMEIQATLRCLASIDHVDVGLHINTRWKLTRVFSISTIAREFAALKALPYFDFYPDIVRPRLARTPNLSPSQIQRAMNSHQVNEPQAIAILGSLQTAGFSLIQGPPGTGKTWTICGIVGAFISSRPRPATIIQAGRNSISEKSAPLKILVCAPSNAAIDEVAKRLRDGVRTSDGTLTIPNIVRVGAEEAINISVKDLSLDQLVDQRLNSNLKQNISSANSGNTMTSLRAEMDALKISRESKLKEMTNIQDNVSRYEALELELKALNNKRMALSQQFNRVKDQLKSESRTLDAARRKHRAEVLIDADVVCATLSGAGHDVLENLDFEMIVIDEAAQAIELSSLIPLKFRSKRCIMVGDPQQLPPTVLSPMANKFGYGQSLFVRLQKSHPEAVHLLSIQYRMHPDISRIPSQLFYGQRLLDGPGMIEKTSQIWHQNPLFGTYKFINVSGGNEQAAQGHSLLNHIECETALAIYNRLKTEYPKIDFDFRIGIIAMYRAQLMELKKKFRAFFGADIVGKVDFNTVDGFQGQEKDIIILSCVRAGPGVQSIGFLTDQRRLNVAITRARSSLFILGHAATLERSDQMWKHIVQDARSTSRMFDVSEKQLHEEVKADRIILFLRRMRPLIGDR